MVPLLASHSDHSILAPLVESIFAPCGGVEYFRKEFPPLLRQAIDEVIDAPRTNRFKISEIEKTEKTYLGTKIEILLRSLLQLPKGNSLDMSVNGVEVDVKNTMLRDWYIPPICFDQCAILVRENDKKAKCDVGLVYVRTTYLNSKNWDKKQPLSAAGKTNIWWILKDHPYPQNLWETLPKAQMQSILNAGKGTKRVAELFRQLQKRPISRTQIQALAQQEDYMKRVRRQGGARDILAPQGIAILWGSKDGDLLSQFQLPNLTSKEFISYAPVNPQEAAILRQRKHID